MDNGAVNVVRWIAEAGWLVGFENGVVLQLDAKTLRQLESFRVEGSVWEMDAKVTSDGIMVGVGAQTRYPYFRLINEKGRFDAFCCQPTATRRPLGDPLREILQ